MLGEKIRKMKRGELKPIFQFMFGSHKLSREKEQEQRDKINKDFLKIENIVDEEEDLLPQEKQIVDDKITQAYQRGDFAIEGRIPYLTLYNNIMMHRKMIENDDDAFNIIKGNPGTGKSSTAILIAKILDSKFSEESIIYNHNEFLNFLERGARTMAGDIEEKDKVEPGSVIIVDEGLMMFFSKDSMTREGKTAEKMLSIVRALNLFFIVNVTNINRINKSLIEDRVASIIDKPKKDLIKYYSRAKMRRITTKNQRYQLPPANLTEPTGCVSRECEFWKRYTEKKNQYIQEKGKQYQKELQGHTQQKNG